MEQTGHSFRTPKDRRLRHLHFKIFKRKKTMTTPSKPAATVILVRPDLKFYRCAVPKSLFFSKCLGISGGRVDEADKDVSCYGEITGLDHNYFAVAAIRECYEEAGIWFGIGNTTEELRTGLNNRSMTLSDAPHLQANLDRMELWSWWITPENEPKRYDTRFFICELSEEESKNTKVDNNEMVEYQWLTAEEALKQHATKHFHWLHQPL